MQLKGISVDKENWKSICGVHGRQEKYSSGPEIRVQSTNRKVYMEEQGASAGLYDTYIFKARD